MIKVENYFEAFLIISLVVVFLFIIKSFLMSLLFASVMVFLFYKPYQHLLRKINNETIASLLIIFFVLFIILIPSYLVINSLVIQSSIFLSSGNSILQNFQLDSCKYEICRNIENNFVFIEEVLDTFLFKIKGNLPESVATIFGSIYGFVLNFFIFIFAFFFLLKDGHHFIKYLKRLIPMKNEYKEALFVKFRDVSSAVFRDTIFVALIQGFLAGLGFWFFGVPSPFFWAVIASFFALIPIVGTTIIWVPATIYLFLIGDIYPALALFVYCAVIVGLSDNIIRPLLLKKKIPVHPFLIFLSILGGIQLFGFMGIFMGPIVISLMVSVFQLYKLEFK